jgi:predicted Rossmann-fold nucleotide-binding protein
VIRHESLTDRLLHVVRECDAAVACGGGIGTLSELSLIWSFVQTGEVPPVPIIMLGQQWQALLDLLADGGVYIGERDLSFVKIAKTPQDVIDMLANWS